MLLYIKIRLNGSDIVNVTAKESITYIAVFVAAFVIIRIAFVKYEKHLTKKLENKYDDE